MDGTSQYHHHPFTAGNRPTELTAPCPGFMMLPEKEMLLSLIASDNCMNDTVLCRTDSIKDLGIDTSSSLVWNDHIRRVVNKCNKKWV